ncbi:hypothetical protein ABPG77_010000 [Micractinium sp. CCAP 211/92]
MLLPAHLGAHRHAAAVLRPGKANTPKRVPKRVVCRPVRAFVATEGGEQHAETTVTVHFTLIRQVPFGQELKVCGNAAQLGGWDLDKALSMTWSEGDRWQASVALPAGAGVEWKFVQTGSTPQWEGCLNRTLCVDAAAADLTCLWDAPMATMVGPVSIDCAAEQLSEDELSTEDDAPPPAFKPAAALAQFADAVKASFGAGGADAAAAAPAAGSLAAGPTSLLAAAAEVLTADSRFDPLDVPAGAAAAALADKTAQQAELPAGRQASPPPGKAVQLSPEAEAAVSSYIEAAGPTQTASSSAAPGPLDSWAEADEGAEEPAAAALLTPAKPAGKAAGPDIKAIGKVAGTVAMGVGAAAMLSAFAVDIADVAVLGAVAAGSMAALKTPSTTSSGKKAKKGGKKKASKRSPAAAGAEATSGADVEAVDTEEEAQGGRQMISQKASAPGVILAASVLSAIDVGKKILASSDEDDSSPDNGATGSSTSAAKKGQ